MVGKSTADPDLGKLMCRRHTHRQTGESIMGRAQPLQDVRKLLLARKQCHLIELSAVVEMISVLQASHKIRGC